MLDATFSTLNHHLQSLLQFPNTWWHIFWSHFSKSCWDWTLDVYHALAMSHINLEMTPQIKIHRGQIKWTRTPRDIVVSRTTASSPTVCQILIEPILRTLGLMRWGLILHEMKFWRIRVAEESWVHLLRWKKVR